MHTGKVGGYQKDIARLMQFCDDKQLTEAIRLFLEQDDKS